MGSAREDRREQILDAAQGIAEREGLEGLTMRKLCAELGLSAPIVYRLFANKGAIVDGLVERLLGTEARPHEPGTPVGPWLYETFTMVRREQIKHPELLPLMADTRALIERGLALSDMVLGALREAGLSPAEAGPAFQALMAFTIGSVLTARAQATSGELLAGLLPRYPRVMECGLMVDPSSDEVYARGLKLILRGLGLEPTPP